MSFMRRYAVTLEESNIYTASKSISVDSRVLLTVKSYMYKCVLVNVFVPSGFKANNFILILWI